MRTDVVDLRDFYSTSLGRVAQRMIRRRLRLLWPDVSGLSMLGLGYATPFLRPFRDEAARLAAIMPASQGVLHWPPDEPNLVALADEAELPLPDLSMDRVLLVHAIETAEELRPMMREVWRVLAGNGRVLVVAPNRRGVWARREGNPFGSGRPYSVAQLERLMRDTMFTPLQTATALHVPPSRWRMVLTAAEAWEEAGARWFPVFGGVVMIEATKQIYAAAGRTVRKRRRELVPAKRPIAVSAAAGGPDASRSSPPATPPPAEARERCWSAPRPPPAAGR